MPLMHVSALSIGSARAQDTHFVMVFQMKTSYERYSGSRITITCWNGDLFSRPGRGLAGREEPNSATGSATWLTTRTFRRTPRIRMLVHLANEDGYSGSERRYGIQGKLK